MNSKLKIALIIIGTAVLITVAFLFFRHLNVAVLAPEGVVAAKERDLMIAVTLLTLIVVIPVFVLLAYIVWTYREGNTKAKYEPEWSNHKLELVWWGVPLAIITALSVIIWQSSHDLDPYRPLVSEKKPLAVQVVALQWKWLFIYPEQNIATVNYVKFPEDTPVNFQITGDAPMNAFWIPKLGGQVYAMAGMTTQLHLMADRTGVYPGSSANLSGEGFAGMKFDAESVSAGDFDSWVQEVKQSPRQLQRDEYLELAAPSKNHPRAEYAATEFSLFDKIIARYMAPLGGRHEEKAE